ncbi:MAG: helix-turn-helix domain-containing protein [Muribaculaceae bacterium]
MPERFKHNIYICSINSRDLRDSRAMVHIEQNGILYCRAGSITLTLDERDHTLHAGDCYIYPAFSYTYLKCFTDDFEGYGAMADFDFVLAAISTIDARDYVNIRFQPIVRFTDEQRGRVVALLDNTMSRLATDTPLKAQVVTSLAQAVCCEILDAYISNCAGSGKRQSRSDIIFENFMQALYKHSGMHRDVAYYAGLQCVTSRYFTSLIHKKSGRTPLQWIAMFVISEAKHLLTHTDMSIKEIADKLNFPNQSFFGRYFKHYAGVSPSVYRAAGAVNSVEAQ